MSTLLAGLMSADGLTWAEFVDELPTDPASIFTLLLLSASIAWVLWAGRSKPPGGRRPGAAA